MIWCATSESKHALPRAVTQPARTVSGNHDSMLPADNGACAMFQALSDV